MKSGCTDLDTGTAGFCRCIVRVGAGRVRSFMALCTERTTSLIAEAWTALRDT